VKEGIDNMSRIRNRILILLVLISLFLQMFSFGAAAAVNPNNTDSIKVVLDGQTLSFEVPPVNENGRVMVPMRAIFEALGSEVYWCETTRSIHATKGDITIRLTLDQTDATVNGETVTLQAPAKLINSRTFFPLRFVAEALSCEVYWDGAAKLVTITSEKITSEQTAPAPEPEPAKPAKPVIRYTKDEGNRIAYYINTDLVAEVAVSENGTKDKYYYGDDWYIYVSHEYFSYKNSFGQLSSSYMVEPFSYFCYNGSSGQVYFPTDEWRTDPKIRQDQKDAMEFVLDDIEARNTKLRPLRGY